MGRSYRYSEDNDCDYDNNEDFYMDFQDPGGRSALRRATKNNPRNCPCPTCGGKNLLTPADVSVGYQCNNCADRDEGNGGY